MTDADSRRAEARARLSELAGQLTERYRRERRVLSFDEYLDLFAEHPARFARDASRYLRDCFDHFGTRTVERPWGSLRRFRLFDLDFLGDEARRSALVGHEELQGDLYRILENFVREGRPNKLTLLHGPNGSAKSTLVGCIFRALERYSRADEGALYRFHWVFPSQKTLRGAIGFGGDELAEAPREASYAHLPESQIDARLVVEVRDHPLFLLPLAERRALVLDLYEAAGTTEPPSEWMLRGQLSHKNQEVMSALLASYDGDLREVLRHVQVERYDISHRYRTGAATVGPQMSVDAAERQVTADRSLSALPTALQATTLFEVHGELVDAQGGLLEFSDLLKRPIDAFKYLQLSIETGEVSLSQQTMQLNAVMIASANEIHLDALRSHHEWASFRGRFELLRTPYLVSYLDEEAIYDAQIVPLVRTRTAPHATRVAAMFAVLSRMRRPSKDQHEEPLATLVESLSALEKADLYATGAVPDRLDADEAKIVRAGIAALRGETAGETDYEGRVGASPREMRTAVLNAAQHPRYGYLSPFGVLDELAKLAERKVEYEWLQIPPAPGGYHDPDAMLAATRERLEATIEEELRVASGLVDETTYAELFERYVSHVSALTKGEKLRSRVTGMDEAPDVDMMAEVERLLGADPALATGFRQDLIATIAAWAIDHPGAKVVPTEVFPGLVKKMRAAVFADRRGQVAALARDLLRHLREGPAAKLEPARLAAAQAMATTLEARFGYDARSTEDAIAALLDGRLRDALP